MGGGLAVGDHDDLLRAGLAGQQAAGDHEAVLHVGAVGEVPRHLRQLRRGQLVGRLGEAHDAQVVARELRGDQRVQRHRDLLGGQEVVAHRHRQRQVQHQHRGGARQQLGALDLEVVGREAHRCAGALAGDGVAHGALDVQVEGVAELVRLGLVGELVADAALAHLMAADLVVHEAVEQVAQRVLPDAAQGPRRQLQAPLGVLCQP